MSNKADGFLMVSYFMSMFTCECQSYINSDQQNNIFVSANNRMNYCIPGLMWSIELQKRITHSFIVHIRKLHPQVTTCMQRYKSGK